MIPITVPQDYFRETKINGIKIYLGTQTAQSRICNIGESQKVRRFGSSVF